MEGRNMVLFAASCTVGVLVLFWTLPKWFGLLQLYALHDTREELYALADRTPGLRETRIYRDAEFVISASIYAVRDMSGPACFRFALAFQIARTRQQPVEVPAEYERELTEFFSGDNRDVLRELRSLTEASVNRAATRGATANPVGFALHGLVYVLATIVGLAIVARRSVAIGDDGAIRWLHDFIGGMEPGAFVSQPGCAA